MLLNTDENVMQFLCKAYPEKELLLMHSQQVQSREHTVCEEANFIRFGVFVPFKLKC